jgi:hypothetical protein
MASGVFEFRWSVPKEGFRWLRSHFFVTQVGETSGLGAGGQLSPEAQWVLAPGPAAGSPFARAETNPLVTHNALYRTFARLSPNRDGVIQFANEHGNLGLPRPVPLPAPATPGRPPLAWVEILPDWQREIDEFRRAVEVWDMLRDGDAAGLSRLIRWRSGDEPDRLPMGPEEGWFYENGPEPGAFVGSDAAGGDQPPHRWVAKRIQVEPGLCQPGDPLTPGLLLLGGWINEHLKIHTSPRVRLDRAVGKLVLRIVPKNLLGAMWLQFAHSIDGNKEHRSCKECGNWFEISSEDDGRTARKTFCSDPCKSRDYRRRKERAGALRSEGKSVQQIAKELDTDLTTVKKWVTKKKG